MTPPAHRQPPRADQPTPAELAPELVILDTLQALLGLTALTLLLMHPDLARARSELRPLDLQAQLADRLLLRAADLVAAATEYETAVLAALREPEPDPTDNDIPF